MKRFVTRFGMLDDSIIRRLVIENDDKLYNLNACIKLNAQTQIPILFDVFHHKLNNSGNQTVEDSFKCTTKTWSEKREGIQMVDYSSQEPNGSPRQHTQTINIEDFDLFLKHTQQFDFDVMLKIKDKEKIAFKAITLAIKDGRVHNFFLD
jgi:UV DNA damage endonuclease